VGVGHPVSLEFGLPYGIQLIPEGFEESPLLASFVYYLLFVSVTWGLVNLLPIYPLDGGQISREAFLAIHPRDGVRQSLLLSLWAAAAMAVLAMTKWHSPFVAVLFGVLAFQSLTMLKFYSGRGRWQ
jgi:membrane-associated protease RseP (regulator of RpoE activity)